MGKKHAMRGEEVTGWGFCHRLGRTRAGDSIFQAGTQRKKIPQAIVEEDASHFTRNLPAKPISMILSPDPSPKLLSPPGTG